jgi:hypothetical protein
VTFLYCKTRNHNPTSEVLSFILAGNYFSMQVHSKREMERVLGLSGVELIGINNRSLGMFSGPEFCQNKTCSPLISFLNLEFSASFILHTKNELSYCMSPQSLSQLTHGIHSLGLCLLIKEKNNLDDLPNLLI